MLQFFGLLSGFFAIASIFPYIRDILKHKTKPHRVSWLIFTILGSISFFSQLAKGATYSDIFPGILSINVCIIFLLSLTYGVGGVTKKDYLVMITVALALVAWYFTKEPAIALYIVILIDAIGVYLTLEKVYKHPETETASLWLMSSLAGLFSLLAVGKSDIILISYPLFIFFADGSIALTAFIRKKENNQSRLRKYR